MAPFPAGHRADGCRPAGPGSIGGGESGGVQARILSTLYRVLETAATPGMQLDLEGIRKAKILDTGYKAGLRVAAPAADTLDFVLTGNPEVLIRSKTGRPLFQIDPKAFGRIKGDELQMGLAMVLGVLYPQQLVAVRDAAGKWAAVY